VSQGLLVHQVKPVYPAPAIIARVEGKPVDPPRDIQPPFRLVTRESTLGAAAAPAPT